MIILFGRAADAMQFFCLSRGLGYVNRDQPGGRVARPRGLAFRAAGLKRDNGRLGAKAAGLERATLQAGGFCAKSAVAGAYSHLTLPTIHSG